MDYAWRLLCEAGIDRINADPDILNILGRLLKDQALCMHGAERTHLLEESASAYMRANTIKKSTYPLINAATLLMLTGRKEQAQILAHEVLLLLESDIGKSETPYYRTATEAEALLLLGNISGAKTALKKAMAKAPHAFADHASTLRQFSLILTETGADKTWLEAFRPPRSLHYAGHMAMAADNPDISQKIRHIINTENIGYGYGALAAGADICIAEALLESGAELHLILPLEPDIFREVSVACYGDNWAGRYDEILLSADSIRSVGAPPEQLTAPILQLAAEVAMGCAVMQANTLMTDAVQILILDQNTTTQSDTGSSAWIQSAWAKHSRRQYIIESARIHPPAPHVSASTQTPKTFCLAAMLRVARPDADPLPLSAEIVHSLFSAWSKGPAPLFPPQWTGNAVTVTFDTPEHAAEAALNAMQALSDAADISIAGHYGIVEQVTDPFSHGVVLLGSGAAWPERIVRKTPSGTIHLTENFAAALHAGSIQTQTGTEYIGEISGTSVQNTIRLFALTRCPSQI